MLLRAARWTETGDIRGIGCTRRTGRTDCPAPSSFGSLGTGDAVDEDLPAARDAVADPVGGHREVGRGQVEQQGAVQGGGELAESLPDAEFRLVQNAGHTPVYETPEVVAGAVRDVLART
jgi:hypothetical protein